MSPSPAPRMPLLPAPAGKNWAGNLQYFARSLNEPRTTAELLASLWDAQDQVKFLGSRHCFNDTANTDGTMISMAQFEAHPKTPLQIREDSQRPGHGTVRVPGGATYGGLAQALEAQGGALANCASLPHISIAGAIATGTHGSGNGNQPLVGALNTIEFVTPAGAVRVARRDGSGDLPFEAAVHLGALGAITWVEVAVERQYQVRQDLFTNLAWDQVEQNFDAITGAAYSVSMFTRWYADSVDQVWLKSRVTEDLTAAQDDTFFGAPRATIKLHPLPNVDPIHCTEQLGVPGPSHERLAHFKMGFTPSKGEELQSEYLIPRRHAVAAIAAIRALGSQIRPLLFISEIRTMAADGLWLSPSGQEDSVGLHFTWHQQEADVMRLLPQIEAALTPFEARPHWGKLHAFTHDQLTALYPHLDDFVALAKECDPSGVLVNDHLRRTLGL